MVGAPRSPPAPARGPTVNVFYVDGGCFWFYSSGTSQGTRRRRFFTLMVGAPGSLSALTRGTSSMFFTLMVGAPGSTAPTPHRKPVVDVFYVHGGCSRFYSSGTSERARHRCFYANGGCSQISFSTRQVARRRRSVDGGLSRMYNSGTSHGGVVDVS
jgi:hypothetical protein